MEPPGMEQTRGAAAVGAYPEARARAVDMSRYPRQAGFPPLVESAGLGWRGFNVERYRLCFKELEQPPFTDHIVAVALNGYSFTRRRDGEVLRDRYTPGAIGLLPAGLSGRWIFEGAVDALHVRLRPDYLRTVAEANDLDLGGSELIEASGLRDPYLESLARALLAETRCGGQGGRMYSEQLADSLAIHLLRNLCSPALPKDRIPDRKLRGLSKNELGRVVDYMNDNLAHGISLADIAGVAGLSPYHFSRLFKLSTGLSPHRYLVRCRAERARELLLRGWPAGVAARESGFADQSHLNRHFKRLFGKTPRGLPQNSKNVQSPVSDSPYPPA